MNILFTFEEQACLERSLYLINWFVNRGHDVNVSYTGPMYGHIKERCRAIISNELPNYLPYDFWIYSLSTYKTLEAKSEYLEKLISFKGKLIFLDMDDCAEFFTHLITPEIVEKTKLYISNVWFKNKSMYRIWDNGNALKLTDSQLSRFRLIPSFHESSNFREANDISVIPFNEKGNFITFVGGMNGMWPGQDIRLSSITRITYTDAIQVRIKVTGHTDDPINTHYYNTHIENYMKCPRLSFQEYIDEINTSKFSLCPKGNSPHITYRVFEAMKFHSLVFMNKISEDIEYYNPPMRGYEYVEYSADCSDLLDLVKYYASHMDEAENIVNRAYNYWKHFEFDYNGKVSPDLDRHLIKTFPLYSL